MPPPDANFANEEEYEPLRSFSEELYEDIAAPIKQFLISYLGEALNNAEPETFRAIEEVLKEDHLYLADMIPDILYNHCTIKDSKEWDEAFYNFQPDENAVYPWPELEGWYDRPDNEEDDDEDDEETEDDEQEEMPEEAKRIIDHVDDMLDEHQKFKTFMRECCAVIIAETRTYLEKTSSFDLTNLTEEGFMELQQSINSLAETLAENLHAVVADILTGPPPGIK